MKLDDFLDTVDVSIKRLIAPLGVFTSFVLIGNFLSGGDPHAPSFLIFLILGGSFAAVYFSLINRSAVAKLKVSYPSKREFKLAERGHLVVLLVIYFGAVVGLAASKLT